MTREKSVNEDTVSREYASNRRQFLKLTGASAVALTAGAAGGASTTAAAQDGSGPPNPDEWSVAFEDTFDGGSIDDSVWTTGWGWGTTGGTSDAAIASENVTIQDGTLRLGATNDGEEPLTGGVNTKGNVEFGPGTYIEARLKFPAGAGFHPTFWAQSTTDEWPPELDVVELIQDGSGSDDTETSRHFLHYTVSTEPGDESTHERVNEFYEPGDDLTENFHVYGVEWRPDRVAHYVDGERISSWSNSTILESFRKAAPLYLMLIFSVNIDSDLNDSLGQADTSESWDETMDAEWVRVWEQ